MQSQALKLHRKKSERKEEKPLTRREREGGYVCLYLHLWVVSLDSYTFQLTSVIGLDSLGESFNRRTIVSGLTNNSTNTISLHRHNSVDCVCMYAYMYKCCHKCIKVTGYKMISAKAAVWINDTFHEGQGYYWGIYSSKSILEGPSVWI